MKRMTPYYLLVAAVAIMVVVFLGIVEPASASTASNGNSSQIDEHSHKGKNHNHGSEEASEHSDDSSDESEKSHGKSDDSSDDSKENDDKSDDSSDGSVNEPTDESDDGPEAPDKSTDESDDSDDESDDSEDSGESNGTITAVPVEEEPPATTVAPPVYDCMLDFSETDGKVLFTMTNAEYAGAHLPGSIVQWTVNGSPVNVDGDTYTINKGSVRPGQTIRVMAVTVDASNGIGSTCAAIWSAPPEIMGAVEVNAAPAELAFTGTSAMTPWMVSFTALALAIGSGLMGLASKLNPVHS